MDTQVDKAIATNALRKYEYGQNSMADLAAIDEGELLAFLTERLDAQPLLLPLDAVLAAATAAYSDYAARHSIPEPLSWQTLLNSARAANAPVGLPVGDGRSLVLAQLTIDQLSDWVLVSVQHGPVTIACSVVRNALEAWSLSCDAVASQQALEESAMQLAQSFEEQNWLRNFARSAASLSRHNTAGDMASGILRPLGYLLRAQDVYLLVEADESARSGLIDTKFGSSQFSISTIRDLLCQLGVASSTAPWVRNNAAWQTADGVIDSILVVTVCGYGRTLGHLVGINRSTKQLPDGLPVYDPEFGSGDVGLLEEAAVLLSTQAHNIHLLVQSNRLFLGTLHAMSSAVDARDPYTQGHSERVARLSFELARIYGLSEEACQEIYLAGVLHDVGKIGIPDSVLLKEGPLTDEEFKVIQAHPTIGHRIVEQLGHLQFVLPGVLYHHERWDGRGYPHGLQGEAIPMMARILAVADAFDAMTSCRPYRQAMPLQKAEAIISSGAGEQWDAQIVECFKIWIDRRLNVDRVVEHPNQSIIPLDSPVDSLHQAVMTLNN